MPLREDRAFYVYLMAVHSLAAESLELQQMRLVIQQIEDTGAVAPPSLVNMLKQMITHMVKT